MRRATLFLISPCCATAVAYMGLPPDWSGIVTVRNSATLPPNSQAIKPRRTLALFLPYLPSERVSKLRGPLDCGALPFVLTEKQRGAVVIMAADRLATALDLGPGMKLADARARVPELLAWAHEPLADAHLLGQLAEACERYTPMVAIAPPYALILDITGASHFYASETALAQDVEDRLDQAGYSAHWALAGTPDAALALARHGLKEGAEAQLPVSALAMGPNSQDRKSVV